MVWEREQTIEEQRTKNVLDSMHQMEGEQRARIPSRQGFHRPYTRWGGYNRVSHDKDVKDEIMRGVDTRHLHFWDPPEKKAKEGSRGESRGSSRPGQTPSSGPSRAESRGGGESRGGLRTSTKHSQPSVSFADFPDVGKSLSSKTKYGRVSGDWPYNRGSTPPRVDPEAHYAPVDARDENGAPMLPDGRVKGRNYVAVHSNAIETAGGFLNGLPKAGANYRPTRICGKGVKEAQKSVDDEKELEQLTKTFDPLLAKQMMKVKAKKEKSSLDLEDVARQIRTGRLDLSMRRGRGNGQQIELIPDVICRATELREMILSGNKITRLPDQLASLKSLTTLVMDGNGLLELPQNFGGMISLTQLSLRNNVMSRVPMSFEQLTRLTDLDLSTNKFAMLPDEVASISALRTLTVATNVLATEQLTVAGAENDQRKQMPTLSVLCNLHTLNLESNRLCVVPTGIDKLTQLRCLRLAHNRLVSTGTADTHGPPLEAEFELAKLSALADSITTIDLSNNAISCFPPSLCKLSLLTSLDLRSNFIPSLPETLSAMIALSNLYLDRNPITAFPHCLNTMWWLTTLSTIHLPIGDIKGLLGGGGGVVSTWRRGHIQPDPRVMERLKEYRKPKKPGVRTNYVRVDSYSQLDSEKEERDRRASQQLGLGPVEVATLDAAPPAPIPEQHSPHSHRRRALSSEFEPPSSSGLSQSLNSLPHSQTGSGHSQRNLFQRAGSSVFSGRASVQSSGRHSAMADVSDPRSRSMDSDSTLRHPISHMRSGSSQVDSELGLAADVPLGFNGPRCMIGRPESQEDPNAYQWWKWAATTPYVPAARLSGTL